MGGNQQEQINEAVKGIRAAKRKETTPARLRGECKLYNRKNGKCFALTETTCLAGECQFYTPRPGRLGEEVQ